MKKKTPALTVTELTNKIRHSLGNQFSDIIVVGEVSGLTHARSGHLYFTLKDPTAQINGIIWKNNASRMKFEIKNGMDLICKGSLDVYPVRGSYSLIVQAAHPVGEGALQLAFRQLHDKLEKEGLFDPQHKRPLPRFPQRIAVITSPSGAAIRDFLQVLNRRWSNLEVVILPAKVQGPGSAEEIARAIDSIKRFANPPDVVVVTRGGGSIEDLWSFNEEIVCRAVHACPVPVISGVGHEIDVTLCDLVADVRALTPSEAAERLVVSKQDLVQQLSQLRKRMRNALLRQYQHSRHQLDTLASRPVIARPLERIHDTSLRLDQIESDLHQAIEQRITDAQNQLDQWTARLESINPVSVLARGYSLTTTDSGKLLTDATQVQPGDILHTRLARGTITSHVESTSPRDT